MSETTTISLSEVSEEQMETLVRELIEGKRTLQQVKGLSDEQMEAIYAMAYQYYQFGKYDQAIEMFNLLGMFNPFESKYWMGLAACLQQSKQFDKAQQVYAVAAMTSEPKDPVPHLHAGECCLGAGEIEDAVRAFRMAVDFSKDQEQHAAVHAKAQGLLEVISAAASGNDTDSPEQETE